ncbi:MAG: hypothetical protein HY814_13255, partial [Candidatus Riflebacteria bacterium]|nr:hypothetical protein [Candidatus Riflebacteria bacterium]
TGNRRVNPEAPVRVVVAEILLNHLLSPDPALSGLDGVAAVVMDEFHNFNEPERGIVWELSLVLLPAHVRVMLLSATVGNPIYFGVQVANRSNVAAGIFPVMFHLEPVVDPTTGASTNQQPFFLGDWLVPGLASNEVTTITTHKPLPSYIPAGSYFLRADVDPRNLVLESNETDNVARTTRPVTVNPPSGSTDPNRPDLIVGYVWGPPTAYQGGKYTLLYRVANIGPLGAPRCDLALGLADVQFSPTGGVAPFRTLAVVSVPELPPASSVERHFDAVLPTDVATGTYFPVAAVDSGFVVPEKDEKNNVVVSQSPVYVGAGSVSTPLADLEGMAVSALTTRAMPGEKFHLVAAWRNAGTTEAAGYDVGFVLQSGDANSTAPAVQIPLDRIIGKPLLAGAPAEVITTVRLPETIATGRYQLRLDLDASRIVPESNEYNNSAFSRLPLEVGPGSNLQQPDLVVSAVHLPNPAEAELNTTFTASVVFGNTGGLNSPRFMAELNLLPVPVSGTAPAAGTANYWRLGEFLVEGLEAGSTRPLEAKLVVPGFIAPGNYLLGAYADTRQMVAESNEMNNFGASQGVLTITGTPNHELPDLVSDELVPLTTMATQGRLALHAVVRNLGPGFAAGFEVGFALAVKPELPPPGVDVGLEGARYGFFVLGSSFFSEGLASQARRPIDAEFGVPAVVPPGRYFLMMAADPGSRLPEVDEGNNYRTAQQQVAVGSGSGDDLLDLRAVALSGPTSGAVGTEVEVVATIAATGVLHRMDVPVQFYLLGPSTIGQILVARVAVPVPASAPGSSTTTEHRVRFVVPSPYAMANATDGSMPPIVTTSYALSYFIDPQYTIHEPKDNNFSRPMPFTLTGVGQPSDPPDLKALMVAGVKPTPGTTVELYGMLVNASNVSVSHPVGLDFTLVPALQPGTDPTGAISYQPPLPLGRAFVESAPRGVTLTARGLGWFPAYVQPGVYKVKMRVDPDRVLRETDETNNEVLADKETVIASSATDVTDLVALGVVGPPSVRPGATVPVTGELANRGNAGATHFAVSFGLSLQAAANYSQIPLGTKLVEALEAGATISLSGDFPLPTYVRPGTYYLGLLVDSANTVRETDERNNAVLSQTPDGRLIPLTVEDPTGDDRMADLAAVGVNAQPALVAPGGRLALSGRIENRTTQPVPVDFGVLFFASRDAILPTTLTADRATTPWSGDGYTLAYRMVAGIGAGESRELLETAYVPLFAKPGAYYVGLIVDPEQRIGELPETRGNNKILSSNPVTVTTPPSQMHLPDLIAANLYTDSRGIAGQAFTMRWAARAERLEKPVTCDVLFLMRPASNTVLDSTRGVEVEVDGHATRVLPVGRTQVTFSPAGPMAVATVTSLRLPDNMPAGTYTAVMVVDPDGKVLETDKQNNYLGSSVLIKIDAGTTTPDDDWADDNTGTPIGDFLVDGAPGTAPAPLPGVLETAGDRDVFRFTAIEGHEYVIGTILRGLFDSVLELRDSNFQPLFRDSNSGEGYASQVRFRAERGGTYYAVVFAPEAVMTGDYLIYGRAVTIGQETPDLVPGPVSIDPILATSTSELTAFCTIVNAGRGAVTTAFAWELRVEDHLDADSDLAFRPVAHQTVVRTGTVEALAAGSTIRLKPAPFGPLPAGKYDLVLAVDTAGQVEETDESNNARPTPFGVGNTSGGFLKADLVPAGVYFKPMRPTTENVIVAGAALVNKGGTPVTTFAAELYLDRTSASRGRLLRTFKVEGLRPDSVYPLPVTTLGKLSEGQHNLVLVVDSQNEIVEVSEQNNTAIRELYVSGSTPSGYDLVPEHLVLMPETPTAGSEVSLGLYVANRGSQPSPMCELRVFVDSVVGSNGTLTSTPTVVLTLDSIAANSGRLLPTIKLPPFEQPGQHFIVVRLDAQGAGNVETVTANNQASLEFCVTELLAQTRALFVRGKVYEAAGNLVGAGYKVRIVNLARRAVSIPVVTSAAGSFETTLVGLGDSRIAAVEGDPLEFAVEDQNGQRFEVADPVQLVLDAEDFGPDGLVQDLNIVPPPRDEIVAEIVKPEDGVTVLADEKIEFRGRASYVSTAAEVQQRLLFKWMSVSGGHSTTIAFGESFATRLKPGRHQVELQVRDIRGNLGTDTCSINVEQPTTAEVHSLTILGDLTVPGSAASTQSRTATAAPTEELTVTITNATRKLTASTVVPANTGRYAVVFTDPTSGVAAPGDRFQVDVSAAGRKLPVSPQNFSVGQRDILAGQHVRNLRVHYEPDQVVKLAKGVNLISVPVRPVTEDGSQYDASQLVQDLNLNYLVRTESSNGRQRFRVFLPGFTDRDTFPVAGNEGYIGGRSTSGPHTFRGVRWEQEQLDRDVNLGVNTLGFPQGVPPATDAGSLTQQTGARYLIRTIRGEGADDRGRFQFYLPGHGSPFPIEPGQGLLMGAPDQSPLSLDPGLQ